MSSPAPADSGSPMSPGGIEPLVPENLQTAFNAAKEAKLLSVHGVDGVGCGWLTIRLLGDWLRQCTFDSATGKSDIGIVLCSFKQNIDYYISNLQPLGVDLAWHVEKGHLTFLGNQYQSLITNYDTYPPTPPSITFEATLELLMERSYEMRSQYKRNVLVVENPEMGMILTTDDDDVRVEKWLYGMANAAYSFDNAIVGMMISAPHPIHFPVTDHTADAAASAVLTLNQNCDMAITVRPRFSASGPDRSDRVSIVYRMDHHIDVGDEVEDSYDTDRAVKVANGGNISVTTGTSW
ncbi:60S ribosomal protein L37 [Sporothrix eucalyptigena]|uniref:60S ribosomal protein L37 n=1 Tax=Sporothrix eucalyptigena TaxID=1812306 RepID=A0ABP0BF10_9PEZI